MSLARATAARQRVEKELVSGSPAHSTLRCTFWAQGCLEAPWQPVLRGSNRICSRQAGMGLPGYTDPVPCPLLLSGLTVHSQPSTQDTFFSQLQLSPPQLLRSQGLCPPSSSSWAFSPAGSAGNMPSVVSVNSLQASVPWPLDSCCGPQPAQDSPTAGPGLGPGLECHPP